MAPLHGGDSRDSGLTAGCRFYLAGISGRVCLQLLTHSITAIWLISQKSLWGKFAAVAEASARDGSVG